ncbi:hypothetical protein ABBQ32_001279 [Trebouxia sp. C0010 RCD-2024]
MVGFFGRFREKVSEVSGPAGHFKATSNDRVNLMYKEAGEFARRLQKCSNQIKAVESATAALLLTTEDTLSRPMPHVYQVDAESHQATPIVVPEAVQQETNAAVGSGIGSMSDVNVKDLRIIANQQNQKMQVMVMKPLNQWLAVFKSFSSKMRSLENRRLEFDAERRAFTKLEIKRIRQQQAHDTVEADTMAKLEARNVTLLAKRSEYQAYETDVFEALAALIKDAASLRVYLAAAMRVEAETFTRATSTRSPLSNAAPIRSNGLASHTDPQLAETAPS